MKKFYLIKDDFGRAGTWYIDGGVANYGPYWENISGGRMPKRESDNIVKVVEAEDWEDLNWKETYLGNFERDLREGWLSPTGEFVQADYRYHEDVAEFIIGKTSTELENQGWVKLSSAFDKGFYTKKDRLTSYQKTWLNKNEFNTEYF